MPTLLIVLILVAMVMFPPLAIITAIALGIILLANEKAPR